MTRNLTVYIISFVAYVLAQVFFKNLVLFNSGYCILYVVFILMKTIETSNLLLMIAGFAIGFIVDVYYNSLGLHAFTMVFIAYLRNYWLGTITPQGGYDPGAMPNLPSQGVQWFLVYTMPLVFLHNLILFLVESTGTLFWYSMLKTISSLIFTMKLIVILQYLLQQRSRA